MKEKLKKFWRKVKMTAKEVVETIRDAVTNPDTRIATGMFVTFIGLGLMASGAMSKRLANAA